MENSKTSKKTLLLSILFSAPGPLILGIGLTAGQSSTQLADFFRRSAELLAIICSFMVFCITQRDNQNENSKVKLERASNIFVGFTMCVSAITMFFLAIFKSNTDKGNVIGGFIIAFLGIVANTLFSIKYYKINKETHNPIISVQARLYKVKSIVDLCVVLALAFIIIIPTSIITLIVDLVASILVSIYLSYCGVKTIMENKK